LPEKLRVYLQSGRPFEFRPVQVRDYASRTPMAPIRQIWFRAVDRLSDDDPVLHRCLLAYISDYHLLETAILPHVGSFARLQVASIDHAMWFHRSFRADEWMLYSMDSPSASDARGFARGSIFDRDGALIASTAQEGLMRARDPDDG
jgi:acyl-CoA thioesterase-2